MALIVKNINFEAINKRMKKKIRKGDLLCRWKIREYDRNKIYGECKDGR